MLKLPVTYLTKLERNMGGSVMVPGMPVSDGMLSDIEYRLGEVEGRPAMLTSLTINENHISVVGSLYGRGGGLRMKETLWLYRLKQGFKKFTKYSVPYVWVTVEQMDPELKGDEQPFQDIEMRNVDGHLVLVGDMFADELMGWALVRVREDEASSQTVLTNNRLY